MKRIWFSIAFLTVIISFCVGEQIYIKNTTAELYKKIDTIQIMTENENNQNSITKQLKSLEEYWYKKHKIFFVMCDHDEIDEIHLSLFEISKKTDDQLKSALADAKAQTISMYENQKLSLANIF